MEGAAESKSDDIFWYFAIGSMINPFGLGNRGIEVVESQAAEALDNKIYFYGSMGMAEAIAEEGSSFHGVVHRVNPENMAKLDRIEACLLRRDIQAKLYDGSVVTATVYCRDPSKERGPHIDKNPSQRYLEIIAEGCKHFGVVQSYIDFIEKHPCVPRCLPGDFKTLPPVPEGAPTMTLEEVLKNDGQDGRPLYFTINGKVRQNMMEGEDYLKSVDRSHRLGHHLELIMCKMLYDPKYGCPETLDQVTREHAACIEDVTYNIAASGKVNTMHEWKVIANFDQPYKD